MTKEFVLKNPDAPVSFKQGIMIRRLTGEDIRQRVPPLTMQQAADIIKAALANGATKGQFKSAEEGVRVTYKHMMQEATKAANEAGKAWLAQAEPQFVVTSVSGKDLGYPPMLDVCGFVYIEILDKRTAFARWCAKNQDGDATWVIVPHHYRKRQEMGLKYAAEKAALTVFEKYGITNIRIYERID